MKKIKYVVEIVNGIERRSKVFYKLEEAEDYFRSCLESKTTVILIKLTDSDSLMEIKRKVND